MTSTMHEHNGILAPPANITAATIADWLRLFYLPGEVAELRALDVVRERGGWWTDTLSGYFDYEHFDEMARHALEIEKRAKGVYFTLNPLKPAILSRCCNRIDLAKQGQQTSDGHVLRRKLLLVDCDPVREVSDIPSTDEEKAAAWDTAQAIRSYLAGEDWADPVLADSGNGYHLLYKIDLPAEDGGLVKRTLEAVAQQFDTDRVTIDRKVFNPARITKLYGTLARKGDHTPQRPHRRSCIIHIPDNRDP
jgi:hypothetical protein